MDVQLIATVGALTAMPVGAVVSEYVNVPQISG